MEPHMEGASVSSYHIEEGHLAARNTYQGPQLEQELNSRVLAS